MWQVVARAAGVWLGPLAITASAVGMLYWSWGTWPDVLIDFGRELYVPWQLSEGKILYIDIAYFNGPLSPYWNALWFRVFGVSLRTLTVCNLLLLTMLLCLLYGMLSRIADRLSATIASLAFLALFACGQLVGIGNYNFVAPYSHELTHGTLLVLASLYCLRHYGSRDRPGWLAAAGFGFGLLFLTKIEIFVAGGLAILTVLALTFWLTHATPRRLVTAGTVFVGAALLGPLAAVLFFARTTPFPVAVSLVGGHWGWAMQADALSQPFFQRSMGLDNAGGSIRRLAMAALVYAAILGPGAAVALACRAVGPYRQVVAIGSFLVVAFGMWYRWRDIPWLEAARPLPLVVLILAIASMTRLIHHRDDADHSLRLAMRLGLIVFALAMLGKMVLNARLYNYGFALAMPATLLLVVALVGWAPALIHRLGGSAGVFRGVALAALAVAVWAHLQVVHGHFDKKRYAVGHGSDAFVADARGWLVNRLIDEVRPLLGPGHTLAVFPEGVMLNYLLRLENPTPYLFFGPFDLRLFGEETILAALQSHPPDYVVLAHKDTSEYGVQFFGRDYGQATFAWIVANYRPMRVMGAIPFHDRRFGMVLMQRQTPHVRPRDGASGDARPVAPGILPS